MSIRLSLNGHFQIPEKNSPDASSTEREWQNIQMTMQEASKLGEQSKCQNDGVEDSEECIRAITFSSPDRKRESLGTIVKEREEIELLRKSMELDEEAEFIEEYQMTMEENFALMFTEITKRRINLHKEPKVDLDLYELVDSLNLPDFPHNQWANILETVITQAMM